MCFFFIIASENPHKHLFSHSFYTYKLKEKNKLQLLILSTFDIFLVNDETNERSYFYSKTHFPSLITMSYYKNKL